MKAGIELDTLIAEKVMGFKKPESIYYDDLDKSLTYFSEGHIVSFLGSWEETFFNPSESIADAWLVMEKFKYHYLFQSNEFNDGLWECKLSNKDEGRKDYVTAKTALLAICLASLKACGVDIVDNVNIVDKGR